MKTTEIISKLNLNLLALSVFFCCAHNADAACVAGSITLRAPLYIVSVDANRLLTYRQQIGTVVKKAALRSDCVGYTMYTISGTQNLPYPEGTQFLLMGKNDFTTPTPTAIYLYENNGSIDKTITASGAQTGSNSDSFSIYLGSSMVMKVKQPWH